MYPKENLVFKVLEGENMTIKCEGYGYGQVKPVFWSFNSTYGNYSGKNDDCPDYDKKLCQKVSLFRKSNVSINDSGTYTCLFHHNEYKQVTVAVVEKVYKGIIIMHAYTLS